MTLALLLTHQHRDDVDVEYTDAEIRAAVEMLDASELKSLIQKIYAADGGLH